MRNLLLTIFTTIILIEVSAQVKQPADYVNPLIGTDKSNHPTVWESMGATFPGVLLPFGMVQIAPNGYVYSNTEIKSFSFLNHYSGYTSSASFNLMALTGDSLPAAQVASGFDHANEKASPYRYQVLLKKYNINVEFTTTQRAALCRFTFPRAEAAHLILSDISDVSIINNNSISGRSGAHYFIAKFSKPFNAVKPYSGKLLKQGDSSNIASAHAILIDYTTMEKDMVLIRIGFSTKSAKGAENNLQQELPGWDFEQVCLQSKKTWNQQLGKINVRTPDQNLKQVFYTALYHSMFMPVILSDADDTQDDYSALFPWDTYRCKHPLITLLDPKRESDMIASVLRVYDNTSWLPTDNMMGNHNTELILDSYLKGATGFDVDKACEAMSKSLTTPPYARREMNAFVQRKFVPASISSSVTHSLEFAYNSWAVANFLEQTGNKKKYQQQYDELLERASYFKNSFDPATFFMRAKTIAGQWAEGGYCEGTEWTYSWYVPHDVQGLINLMGGEKAFSKKLTECFEDGHFMHDNEPPMHYPYLFNFCGQPWKTQLYARQVVEENYSNSPGGLPGNDDLGTLSSWYVFSALGFYPVTPGTTQYQIGSPVFEESIIHLADGKQFLIKSNHVSKKNKFIQSARLNGRQLNRPWLTQQDIKTGHSLVLEMGPLPNKTWGTDDTLKPYSMSKGIAHFSVQKSKISSHAVKANDPIVVSMQVKNDGPSMGTFTVPLYVDGKFSQTLSSVFAPNEIKTIQSEVTLYHQGIHNVKLGDQAAIKVEVQKTAAKFLYSELSVPLPPLAILSDSLQVKAKIKNIGSYKDAASVVLHINGQPLQSKNIPLDPGEEKQVSFAYKLTREGISYVSIGDLQPVMINVLDPSAKKNNDYTSLTPLHPLLIMDFEQEPAATTHDFSGLGNNGIIKGNLEWVKSPYGKAIKTDASHGNYVVFPDTCALDQLGRTAPLTMMAWIYPDGEQNFADIISKGDWNSLQIKGSNQLLNFYTDGWEGHEATAPVPANWNRHWHHLAGVADGKNLKLYLDGRLVETKQAEPRNPKGETGIADYSQSLWNIGRNEGSPDRVFHGAIDDVMIFKQALSQQQVVDLMLHNF